MPKSKNELRFKGVSTPNTTQVPDQYLDELLSELTGAELKVLLYITRRTFGFKKPSDNISLSQLLKGITTKDGRVLDKGTGLTKPTLLKAIRSLQEKNIIHTERRRSLNKGDEATGYSLVFDVELSGKENLPPVVKKINQGGDQISLPDPVVNKSAPQETVIQETVNNSPSDLTVRQQQNDVVVTLRKYGIPERTSQNIAESYSQKYINEKVEFFDWLMENDGRRIEKNPVGFLISAIRDNYKPDPIGDSKTDMQSENEIEQSEQRDYSRYRSDLPATST